MSSPAPADSIRRRSRLSSVSTSPASPQSKIWLLASTQQSISADTRQTAFGAHSIVDAFRHKRPSARDAGFEIDDPCIRLHAGQLLQSRAPNIRELDSSWNSSVRLLGETDVIPGRFDIALVKKRVTWMGQDLIYSASRHYVSAQKQPRDLPRYRAG